MVMISRCTEGRKISTDVNAAPERNGTELVDPRFCCCYDDEKCYLFEGFMLLTCVSLESLSKSRAGILRDAVTI